jgi:hypothetical protein
MSTSTSSASLDDIGSVTHRNLLTLIWVCYSVAFLFMLLRTAIRFTFVGPRPTSEDGWMFLALAALTSLCIIETIQLPSVYYITGALAGAIPLSADLIYHTEEYLRWEFPIIILFWSVLWSVKAGFLALYYKLFRELPLYRRVWFFMATFTFLAFGGCIVTLCLSCGPPISNFFEFNKCASEHDVWSSNFSVYFGTAVDAFTDLCSKFRRNTVLGAPSNGDPV